MTEADVSLSGMWQMLLKCHHVEAFGFRFCPEWLNFESSVLYICISARFMWFMCIYNMRVRAKEGVSQCYLSIHNWS